MSYPVVWFKVQRRRWRRSLIGRYGWYRDRYAKKLIHQIPRRNVRAATDIEVELSSLGTAISPLLLRMLDDPETPWFVQRVLVHVLTTFGQEESLDAVAGIARDGHGRIRIEARRCLVELCEKLQAKRQLPPHYAAWLETTGPIAGDPGENGG